MGEINFSLLQPVDTGALALQGFQTGMALVKQVQGRHALSNYMSNPDDPGAYNALAYYDPSAAATMQHQRLEQRKVLLDEQDRQRAVALGGLYNADPQAARTAAIDAGDFDLAKQFGELGDADRKRSAEFWKDAGPVAYRLKQTKDPAERQALWQQARPILEANGAEPSLLDKFDPTNDTQLDAAITTSQTVSQLIDQGKITWHQQGEQPSFATDSMGRPVGTQNPYAKGGDPSNAGGAAQPQAVASTLKSGGLPDHVVAGFLGNFHAEGGYEGAEGDGGSASGIAQWRGDRQANFQRVIGKPVGQATPEEQAKFVLWEMQNPEAAGMTADQRDAILNAKTAAEAADLIDRFYERSSGKHRAVRIATANRFAGVDSAVHVTSKAELDALPSGTAFIAPDGSRRRKP